MTKVFEEGSVKCHRCDGHGLVASWSQGVKEPDECKTCAGSGYLWRYKNGAVALYRGGPFVS